MQEETLKFPEPNVRCIAPATTYETAGAKLSRAEYPFEISGRLVRTGRNFYDSKKLIPDGKRMSLASEELAMQLALEKEGKDPRKADLYDDLFGRNNGGWYAWMWTLTGLRIPDGVKPGEHHARNGRKYFVRQVLEGDRVVGEVDVPEGDGRVVTVWNEVSGIPAETSDRPEDMKLEKHTTHFYFNASPSLDEVSEHYDVAVARYASWHHDEHDWCLDVDAGYGRWNTSSRGGFRPVQGSDFPEVKIELKKVDIRAIERELSIIFGKDLRTLPVPVLLEKYPAE